MKHIIIDAYLKSLWGKTITLLVYLIFSSHFICFSQTNAKIDSLEALLSKSEPAKKIVLLDQLTSMYLKSNTDKSLEYAHQMISISTELKNYSQLQKSTLNIARSYFQLREFDSAYKYVNRAVGLEGESTNLRTTANSYYLLSDINYFQGQHDVGMENCKKAIKLFSQINDSAIVAKLYKELALLYRETGDYDLALDYGHKSLYFFKERNDSIGTADAIRVIANLYHDTISLQHRLSKLKLAKKYLTNFKNHELNKHVLSSIANMYSSLRQYDSAYIIQSELLRNAISINDKVSIGQFYIGIGNTLMRMDSVDRAIQSFKSAKSTYEEINLPKYVAHADYSLGELYYAIYNYDSALYYLNKSLALSHKIKYSQIYRASLNILTKVYDETKDYEKAFYYYKTKTQYTDSINSEKVQLKIVELEAKFETAQKEQQIIELKHSNEIKETEKLIQSIIFIVTMVVLLLLITIIILQRKKDKQISRQKELFHKKERELVESELEKSKLKEEELQQSLVYKSKQLSTHALHMMQKNSMLQEIQADIKFLSKKADNEDKPDFKRINLQINQSLRSHKDWDVFKLYFEDVNRNFFNSLNKINPDLTTNDHRLCALIKLNMTSKEMASVLNVAPNSIKSSRYRLKKKLGLDAEADLEEFVRGL